MTYICKAALICNKCGVKRETKSLGYDPFTLSGNDDGPKSSGWISPKQGAHLCPDCAGRHLAEKA